MGISYELIRLKLGQTVQLDFDSNFYKHPLQVIMAVNGSAYLPEKVEYHICTVLTKNNHTN